ncbi:MAG: DUF721 domain-containing protein [Flavobacteriaceae bacterium]
MNAKKKDFEPQKLDTVLQQFSDQRPLKKGLTKVRLASAWESVMGKNIQAYTTHVELVGKRLYVDLRSAALKNELLYAREKIVENLNNQVGETVITELIFR